MGCKEINESILEDTCIERPVMIGILINWPIKILARPKTFEGVGNIPVLQYIIA
jgi:hypothetical protein